jgi:hypothetical protein
MGGPARTTDLAQAAGGVDLAHHPLADQVRVLSLLDHAHELVTQNATVPGVAAYNLQISVADTGQYHPYASFTWRWVGECIVTSQPELSVALKSAVKHYGFHQTSPSAAVAKYCSPIFFEQDLLQAEWVALRIPIQCLTEHLLDLVLDKSGSQQPRYRNGPNLHFGPAIFYQHGAFYLGIHIETQYHHVTRYNDLIPFQIYVDISVREIWVVF